MQLAHRHTHNTQTHTPGHVDAGGEHVHIGALLSGVVDADLGVGHTAAVAGLGVGLALLLAVAASWAATHPGGVRCRLCVLRVLCCVSAIDVWCMR